MDLITTLATEFSFRAEQITAVIKLLEEGATVPFIARYRKEVTGGLSDTDLRQLTERLHYLTELSERRDTILKSIESQGKLTKELKQQIINADNKTSLEDLYLPYKPKRRTKAQIAIEAGLQPLADHIITQQDLAIDALAEKYLNPDQNITTVAEALDGAQQILMESFAENAKLLGELREFTFKNGVLTSKVMKDKEQAGQKFADYFEFSEALHKIPSHRALALFRGRKEKILSLALTLSEQNEQHCIERIAETFAIKSSHPWLWQTVIKAWKIKFHLKLELDLMGDLREKAEDEAIKVFKDNLHNLLMAAPAGNKTVIGLDPGLRTGVKVVVVDGTGKLLIHTTIFPHVPKNQWDQSLHVLTELAKKFKAQLVSIGNGTGSRETDRLVAELIKKNPELNLTKVVVSEAGASVYSASEFAANEFPELDVSFRGAVSIARRLQDPLAELVKIDPKAIGVGQYQHDVNQIKLGRGLSDVLEDCVNAVGADVNTASVPLLSSIAGLNETIATNLVSYREQHGRFTSREAIKSVPRLGPKTYEQAIGFLRIIDGDNPLDASAVHPESYPVIDQILQQSKLSIKEIMGNEGLINELKPQQFVNEQFGLPTVQDIFAELKKPGRDPRPEFSIVEFKEGVETINHLKQGMKLQGVITNVANFGAFVDIGVHQDGLVHISEVSDQFVKDIHTVVKVGQIVQVQVLEVDIDRKRIQLTMKQQPGTRTVSNAKPEAKTSVPKHHKKTQPAKPKIANNLGDQLLSAFNKVK